MNENNNNDKELILKTLPPNQIGFKNVFKATMGFYAAQGLMTLIGLVGMVGFVTIVYLLMRSKT